MPDVAFGEWLPDQSQVSSPGLKNIENFSPSLAGWQGIPSLEDTEYDALSDRVRGMLRARTQSGTDFIVAGTADSSGDGYIYETSGFTMVDKSRVAGYTMNPSTRWAFTVYGNARYATNKVDEVQVSAAPGTAYSDLSSHASLAGVIANVEEFIVLGDIIGQGDNAGAIGTLEGGLHWCAIGNPGSWPVVGTDAAINVESDYQSLQGNGGRVMDIIPASDYTAVLQERQVWRMDYVGKPNVFNFRRRDKARGARVPGTGIAIGNNVYFLSASGFLVFNGAQTANIGTEKVDRTILGSIDWQLAATRSSVSHNSALKSVIWSLPLRRLVASGRRGHFYTTSQVLVGYNYELEMWWQLTVDHEWAFSSPPFTEDLSLDGATYGPMLMETASPTGLGDVNLDTMGAGASDSEVLSIFDLSHQIASFTGADYLPGTVRTGTLSVPDGRRHLIRNLRPVFRGEEASVSGSVSSSSVANKAKRTGLTGVSMTKSGVIPIRSAGRYHEAEFATAGPINDFIGFAYQSGRMGER